MLFEVCSNAAVGAGRASLAIVIQVVNARVVQILAIFAVIRRLIGRFPTCCAVAVGNKIFHFAFLAFQRPGFVLKQTTWTGQTRSGGFLFRVSASTTIFAKRLPRIF